MIVTILHVVTIVRLEYLFLDCHLLKLVFQILNLRLEMLNQYFYYAYHLLL